ncbi:MAG: PKD domain-containing protein [Thermoplasmata archaeon]
MLPNARFAWRPEDPRTGVEVTFDASASTDPDGSVTLFRWTFDEGPPVYARGPLVFRTFREAGLVHVELTVFDDLEEAGSSHANVTVREQLPQEDLLPYGGHWEDPDAFLIKNATQWAEVWNVVQGWRTSPPPRPEVNFTEETVILAASGWRPSTGYGLWIYEVLFDGEGIEVYVNLTYPGCGFVGPMITHPVDVARIRGVWSDATFVFSHSLSCNGGSLAYGTDSPRYSPGNDVALSVKNELNNRSLDFGPNHPLIVYRRVGEDWALIESRPSNEVNVTLRPGESFVWIWSTGATANDTVLVGAGSFRLDLCVRPGHSWTFRLTTFFDLL